MKGIYLAALITSLLAFIGYGTLILRMKEPVNLKFLVLAFLLVLPMQPIAFYGVRLPLDKLLAGWLGKASWVYQLITTLYAPLTEEPAKLLPLIIPPILRDLRRENFLCYAMAIGLGFAIGEMWFIAYLLAQNPSLNNLPFYQFGGFAGERLMVCLFHSTFVAVSLWRLRNRFVLGLLGAMTLHFFGNLPIFFLAKDFFGWGKSAWQMLVAFWTALYLFGAIGLLSWFKFGKLKPGEFLYGKTRCPECAAVYPAPLWGLNLGPRRYERCPNCRHWHMVGSKDAVTEELV